MMRIFGVFALFLIVVNRFTRLWGVFDIYNRGYAPNAIVGFTPRYVFVVLTPRYGSNLTSDNLRYGDFVYCVEITGGKRL